MKQDDYFFSHTPKGVQERLAGGYKHSYLKDFIYGAIDGVVTTFAVVSGVAGAELPVKIIIILGMANLVGDGFSMAISNYLGTRAEEQAKEKARKIEESHIKKFPEGEREEIRQIFAAKGFEGEELEKVVEVITSDRKRWVDTMLTEELGLSLEGPSPVRAAWATFAAFVLVGFLPLGAFIFNIVFPETVFNPFFYSTIMTAIAFFVVGALKAKYVMEKWYIAGVETLVVGGVAAGLAYGVGVFLKNII